jgi:predicted AAA+ superfamily ATPase
MYLKRHIEEKLREYGTFSKVVLLLGARQVGKSTLLKNVYPKLPSFTFDAYLDPFEVRKDPDLFLKQVEGPIILDEVQYVPELLSAIKRYVDTKPQTGQFFLTGSQNFAVLKNLSETMAGRVSILTLHPMTLHERFEYPDQHWLPALLQSPATLPQVCKSVIPDVRLWQVLWQGGFPGLLSIPSKHMQGALQSYIDTYTERDIRLLENVHDIGDFKRFMGLLAAITAQEINESQLGRDIGLTHTTARRWISLFNASYQWIEVPPYHGNTLKRLSKKRKGYMADTGIASLLLKLSSPETVGSSPHFGALFESYIIQQIMAIAGSGSLMPNFYHWRTKSGAEVDLILERDNRMIPIEIKASSYVSKSDARGLHTFREVYPKLNIDYGVIIYAGDRCYQVDEKTIALPYHALASKNEQIQ